MAISQRLDIRQGQQLVMTPQLQQAIKLLQLTNLELQEFVEGQLLENPFLERDERENGPERGDGSKPETTDAASTSGEQELTFKEAPTGEAPAHLDSNYDSVDANTSTAEKMEAQRVEPPSNDWSSVSNSGGGSGFSDLDMESNLTREKSLRECLTEQLHMVTNDAVDLLIGNFLIDLVDDSGYFRSSTDAIAARLGTSGTEIERVLSLISGI